MSGLATLPYLPYRCHAQIGASLPTIGLFRLARTCKQLYASFCKPELWRLVYVETSSLPLLPMENRGELVVPENFDWKLAFVQRIQAQTMISNIKMVQNGDFVRTLEFNVTNSDGPVFVLKEGEYVVEVKTRTGKIFDKVEFVTNFGRSYSCGGVGGEDFTVYKGDCLTGADTLTEKWHFKTVLTKFVPKFYFEPAGLFVTKKKVTRITLIYGELLHFVEFEFNDGTYKSGGGNIEGAVRPPLKKQIVTLNIDEYIIGFEARTGQVVDSITLWSNKRGLGTFGGPGGKPTEKTLGMPGESLVNLRVDTTKFKNSTVVHCITAAEWAPFGDKLIWTDGDWFNTEEEGLTGPGDFSVDFF